MVKKSESQKRTPKKRDFCKTCFQEVKKENSYQKYKKTFEITGDQTTQTISIYDQELYKQIIEDQKRLLKGHIEETHVPAFLQTIIANMAKCFQVKASEIFYLPQAEMNEHNFAGFVIRNQKEGFGLEYEKLTRFNAPGRQGELFLSNEALPTGMIAIEVNGQRMQQNEVNKIKYEGVFRLGQKHGCECKIFKNSRLVYEGGQDMGVKEGNGKSYFSNGNLQFEGNFKSGKIDGAKIKEFHDNGQLKRICNFDNGKPYGLHKEYDRFGSLTNKGNAVIKKNWKYDMFYRGKQTNMAGFFEQRPRDETATNWDGYTTTYFINGTPQFIGNMIDGRKIGEGTVFSKLGQLLEKGNFVDNYLQGRKETLYVNGKVHYRGNVRTGLKWGYGKEYNTDGQLVYAGEFIQSMRNGDGTVYCLRTGNERQATYERGTEISARRVDEDPTECDCPMCQIVEAIGDVNAMEAVVHVDDGGEQPVFRRGIILVGNDEEDSSFVENDDEDDEDEFEEQGEPHVVVLDPPINGHELPNHGIGIHRALGGHGGFGGIFGNQGANRNRFL